MADIQVAEQSVPATPSSGNGLMYYDSDASLPAFKNDGGLSGVMRGCSANSSVAGQTIAAADTYITGSSLLIPSFGLQAGSQIRWDISLSKTGAGTATPTVDIRIGANQSTADTSRLQITAGAAQTAAADTGIISVILTVRSVSAAGVIQGTWSLQHVLAATGLSTRQIDVVEATSAAFDNSALAGQFIGLSINNGASGSWPVTQVHAKAWW